MQTATSIQSVLEIAAKIQKFNLNKIFYKEDDKENLKILYWDNNNSLSISDVKVDPLAFEQLLAICNIMQSEKKQNLMGAIYIPFNQYSQMKQKAENDSAALELFSRLESKLSLNSEKYLSINILGNDDIRVNSAGRNQTATKTSINSGDMSIIQKYYDAVK